MDMHRLKIMVAAHKPCAVPGDAVYLPVQVGASLHPEIDGFCPDNRGDNISLKNPNYCELTAVYWAWKNLDADYIGLCHYRRFFCKSGAHFGKKQSRIASGADFASLLERFPLILPYPRRYYIETNYAQYVHAHHEQDLTLTREIISELCPNYLPYFDREMGKRVGHRFNMFVMRRDIFDEYCQWLFPLLAVLEKRLDISGYSEYDSRVFGFVAERLLDVWLGKNGVSYCELPVVFLERQNWLKKGGRFLLRKLRGEYFGRDKANEKN